MVRDAIPAAGSRRTRTTVNVVKGAQGTESGVSSTATSVGEFITKYRPFILLGAGALVVAIVYQIYSRRMSKKKDEEQIQAGLRSINTLGAGAQGTQTSGGRAPLSVDPAVIEVLQQQVLDYQAHVEQLEYALNQRDHQLREIQQMHQQAPVSGGGGEGAANNVIHPAANGNYAGLHGQMDPASAGNGAPLPVQLQQPMPTRDASSWSPNSQQTMGAFSNDTAIELMGQSSTGGGGQFTPL